MRTRTTPIVIGAIYTVLATAYVGLVIAALIQDRAILAVIDTLVAVAWTGLAVFWFKQAADA